MKKLIFLLAVSLLSQMVVAQQKQSDATLEETIEWINNFGKPITNLNVEYYEITYRGIDLVIKKSTRIQDNDDYRPSETKYTGVVYVGGIVTGVSVPFSQVTTYVNEITKIIFSKTQSYFSITFISPNSTNYWLYDLSEKEKFNKTIKAFEHLFFLLYRKIEIVDKTSLENKF